MSGTTKKIDGRHHKIEPNQYDTLHCVTYIHSSVIRTLKQKTTEKLILLLTHIHYHGMPLEQCAEKNNYRR